MDKLKGWLLDFWYGLRIFAIALGYHIVIAAATVTMVTYPSSIWPIFIVIGIFCIVVFGHGERITRKKKYPRIRSDN
jgi:hypothetical protein